jgi:hypothetical protein
MVNRIFCASLLPGVEEECEFRWFVEPGRPVTANEVSIYGENASETHEKCRR